MRSKEKAATYREHMIEVQVLFWTNNIARPRRKGVILPKQAWDSGMVRMQSNESHGIKAKTPAPFHSLATLPAAIEKALIAHGITLHTGRRSSRCLAGRGGLKP